ncbi:MAG: hypothetical protein F6K47_02280 [Symploca sp. SIO2E6]|nr:hypothetical protein [Symploca sp. SIO2E6]
MSIVNSALEKEGSKALKQKVPRLQGKLTCLLFFGLKSNYCSLLITHYSLLITHYSQTLITSS